MLDQDTARALLTIADESIPASSTYADVGIGRPMPIPELCRLLRRGRGFSGQAWALSG